MQKRLSAEDKFVIKEELPERLILTITAECTKVDHGIKRNTARKEAAIIGVREILINAH